MRTAWGSGCQGALTWGGVLALLLAVLGAALRAVEPPSPLPPDAPLERFSEGRARQTVRLLSEEIGFRVNGTPGHVAAAERLAAELRKIPGVEVEVQAVSGTQVYRTVMLPAFIYRTMNVVARLPGRSPDAVLLDAHFDTLVDSVGAADDAAGVAAIVETLRALAREAPLARTLVINLNGGEEAGLFGAAGFLQHRWARDVRVYLYLEAFPGGKAALLGAGPGNSWLAETYARVAPRPLASVVGQDLVQSGLLPHNGDFTPFHEAGLPGLDVAMTDDGWAYHTALDRAGRLQPGGLQHLGDTTLAVARSLANQPPATSPAPHVASGIGCVLRPAGLDDDRAWAGHRTHPGRRGAGPGGGCPGVVAQAGRVVGGGARRQLAVDIAFRGGGVGGGHRFRPSAGDRAAAHARVVQRAGAGAAGVRRAGASGDAGRTGPLAPPLLASQR